MRSASNLSFSSLEAFYINPFKIRYIIPKYLKTYKDYEYFYPLNEISIFTSANPYSITNRITIFSKGYIWDNDS